MPRYQRFILYFLTGFLIGVFSTFAFAQQASLTTPANVSYSATLQPYEAAFLLYVTDPARPLWGVQFDGTQIIDPRTFIPEIPGHYHPAGRQVGYIRIVMGQQTLLVPVYVPKGSQ